MKLRVENINKLCLRCRNQCKQSAASKIIKCPMFEERKNEFNADLKSVEVKGKENVSVAQKSSTLINYSRNSI